MSDRPRLYCIARLNGSTARDAAKSAGFSSKPSPEARELWQLVDVLYGSWDRISIAELDAEAARVSSLRELAKKRVAELDAELRSLRLSREATLILESR